MPLPGVVLPEVAALAEHHRVRQRRVPIVTVDVVEREIVSLAAGLALTSVPGPFER